jgi:hypothetical protein
MQGTRLAQEIAEAERGMCFRGFGDMNCNYALFSLTFTHAPGGLPEPATGPDVARLWGDRRGLAEGEAR